MRPDKEGLAWVMVSTSSSKDPQSPNVRVSKFLLAAYLATLLIGLVAIIAAFLDLMISGRYLPSRDWLYYSRPIAYVVLGTWFISIFIAMSHVSKHKDTNAYVDGIFMAIIFVGFFLIPVANLFHRIIPAYIASVAGDDVKHSYRVITADGKSDKWCRNPVEIEGMPPMIELCDVTTGFRAKLSPGQTIIFGGQGTWMGLYVDHMLPH
ncbi:MAG TPA: hypothetical protein PKA03_07225 [Tabrizicola sp.]|nr:hypothetical protein [Tabrizicola sp.]